MNHKSIAVFLIVLWSIVTLIFTSIFVYFLVNGFRIPNLPVKRFEVETEIASKTLQASEVTTLDIDFRAGIIEFVPVKTNTITVTQTSFFKIPPVNIQLKNGILEIQEQKNNQRGLFVFQSNSSFLKIEVPAKHFDSIQVNMTSGECTGTDLACDNLTITITSGEVELVGLFENIYTKQTSGDIEITTNKVPQTIDAKMTSGEMTVTIPDNDGFVATINKTSGSIDSTFSFTVNLENDTRYIYKTDKTDREYHVDMTSGSFQLYKK